MEEIASLNPFNEIEEKFLKRRKLSEYEKSYLLHYIKHLCSYDHYKTGVDNYLLIYGLMNIDMSLKKMRKWEVSENDNSLPEDVKNLWKKQNRKTFLPEYYTSLQVHKKLRRIGERIGFTFPLTIFTIKKPKITPRFKRKLKRDKNRDIAKARLFVGDLEYTSVDGKIYKTIFPG